MANKWEFPELDAFKEGDQAAFTKLFQALKEKYYSFCFKITRDVLLAEEATLHSFLILWKTRHAIESTRHLENLLYRAAKWKCLKLLKLKDPNIVFKDPVELAEQLADMELPSEKDIRDNEVIYNTYQEHLDRWIQELPEPSRSILKMHSQENKSIDEISRFLNITTKRVSDLLFKAKETLRKKARKNGLNCRSFILWVVLFFKIIFAHMEIFGNTAVLRGRETTQQKECINSFTFNPSAWPTH